MTIDEWKIERAQNDLKGSGVEVGQRYEAYQRHLGPCRIVAIGLYRGSLEPMVAFQNENTGVVWFKELRNFTDYIGSHKRWTLIEEERS